MTGNRATEWPSADLAQLEELTKLGLSASQIGLTMGRTRNAVIGKIYRAGLSLNSHKRGNSRGEPRLRKKRIRIDMKRSNLEPIPRVTRAPRPPRPVAARPAVAPIEPVNGVGITILELNRSVCHTIVGSSRPADGLPRYCGQPAWDETAYCEGHYAAFHVPNTRW